jgi:hypothetical protein
MKEVALNDLSPPHHLSQLPQTSSPSSTSLKKRRSSNGILYALASPQSSTSKRLSGLLIPTKSQEDLINQNQGMDCDMSNSSSESEDLAIYESSESEEEVDHRKQSQMLSEIEIEEYEEELKDVSSSESTPQFSITSETSIETPSPNPFCTPQPKKPILRRTSSLGDLQGLGIMTAADIQRSKSFSRRLSLREKVLLRNGISVEGEREKRLVGGMVGNEIESNEEAVELEDVEMRDVEAEERVGF